MVHAKSERHKHVLLLAAVSTLNSLACSHHTAGTEYLQTFSNICSSYSGASPGVKSEHL